MIADRCPSRRAGRRLLSRCSAGRPDRGAATVAVPCILRESQRDARGMTPTGWMGLLLYRFDLWMVDRPLRRELRANRRRTRRVRRRGA